MNLFYSSLKSYVLFKTPHTINWWQFGRLTDSCAPYWRRGRSREYIIMLYSFRRFLYNKSLARCTARYIYIICICTLYAYIARMYIIIIYYIIITLYYMYTCVCVYDCEFAYNVHVCTLQQCTQCAPRQYNDYKCDIILLYIYIYYI